jgi:N-acetylglucosamine kinase-like BadF-type ATPase
MQAAQQPRDGLVLAVDGGGVKTDLALLRSNGELLALVRGPGSSPHQLGVDGCVELLEGLLAQSLSRARLDPNHRMAAAEILAAGADLPEERAALWERIASLHWTDRLVVDNDTLAVLRSGTGRGWGVAVVCGSGINCIGVAPDGRQARFLSLGQISGDWGGGGDVGRAALGAAARSADGRGPRTILESAVAAHFALRNPLEVARAVHLRELPMERLGELARVVFAAADDDPVAAQIVQRVADEVIAFATAAMRRLKLTSEETDVVLGGGLIRAAPPGMIDRIAAGVNEVAPEARVLVAPSAPIVGAALLGFDELGANSAVLARARSELDAAFVKVEADWFQRALGAQPDGGLAGDHESREPSPAFPPR